ncbi:MAG TPA: PIN domain-containing protein [Solirubrobacteraceae bacterium]
MLLLDNSAWSRILDGAVDEERAETVAGWIEQRYLATSLPFLLEAGYSARSASDHQALMAQLDLLPRIHIGRETERLALQAQRELALVGHHRLAPMDLLIAACAYETGVGVLHYDSDYDIIAARTCLAFESEWLVPPGTL